MLEEAEKLLKERELDFPGNLLKAQEAFTSLTEGEHSGLAYTRLAETMFWLGDYSESTKDKEKYHKQGVDYGKKAVELEPESVAANLWYSANMGSHGMARGIMSSLFYIKDIEKYGKKAIDLDEKYFYGAPLRLLGRFYHQCPGWPVGSGDVGKAIKLLEKAVKVGPKFYLNHLYLADAYLAKRKKDKARDLLKEIVSASELGDFPKMQQNVQSEAKKLQRKA